jgi:hypothetical protein
MHIDHANPEIGKWYRIQNKSYGSYITSSFLTFVHSFGLLWIRFALPKVTGPCFLWPRIFSFTETRVLSLAPGPVTTVRMFLAIDNFVGSPSDTITIRPFPCKFLIDVNHNRTPDVVALVVSNDCFLTSYGDIVWHERIFCQSWRCRKSGHPFSHGIHFKGNYSSILYQFSVHSTNWAHWICETLAVLLWLPFDVSHNSLIVWTNFSWRPGRFIKDGLMLFGYTNNLCLPDGWFLFTQELWTLAGFRFNQPYPEIILHFRRVGVRQFALPTTIPSKYFLMQRIYGQTRFLENMDEITQAFQMAFPSLPWIVITYFQSIEQSVRQFWDANLLFGVHGAGCGSLVFMQENTMFLELATQSCVAYMWQLSQICRIYHVIYMMPGISHFGTRNINLNLSVIQVMISILKVRFGFQ